MKITVTDTSASLKALLTATAGSAVVADIEGDIRSRGAVGVVLRNGATNGVFLSVALSTATVADGLPILADEAFSFDCRALDGVKLVADTGISQEVRVEVI